MEKAVTFQVEQKQCLGILHLPTQAITTGVVIVVGGPQYRVGSHRQFVQLSRSLAQQNIASFRFDYRGMGDSFGEKQSFEEICDDIKHAIDIFLKEQTEIKNVVIWGLCDAASAALMYADKDKRVNGLVLLNPWLRNEQAMAQTMVKFYYLRRLLSRQFWKKLITGKVNVGGSIADVSGFVKDSINEKSVTEHSYQQRMELGIQRYSGKTCLILSGVDLTAKEFEQQTHKHAGWQNLRSDTNEIHRIRHADHTFSSAAFKQQVEQITAQFVAKCNDTT